jgi:serine/threonine protein kinase
MASDAPVALGDVVAGKYRVTRFLGAGGMGVVVEAEHLELAQPVALKFLYAGAIANPGASERFLREARAAVRIRSEHVARVLDVGRTEQGTPFMVMECLDGRDLGQVIQESTTIEIARAVGYVLQACEALAVAHGLGIVHRDLKPSNIFVTTRPDGTPLVKVLDFGISKAVETGAPLSLTSTGEILGSPIYMSPEQLRNTRGVDRRTDIWSLGTVLYELLTRRHPFEAESMPTLCAMIAADPPENLRRVRPDVPPELEAVVLRCLEKQPANRFSGISDLARALLPFAGPDGLASVGRISRIAAGSEVTAASPAEVLTVDSPPRTPAPHEATAASPVAVPFTIAEPSSPTPEPTNRRPRRVIVGALLALGIVVLALAWRSRSTPVANGPPAPSSVTSVSSSVASGVAANAAVVPVLPRVEPVATAIAAIASGAATTTPDGGARLESAPQPAVKTKPHPTPSAPSSTNVAVPASTNEKLPLDPLIDQR